MIDASGYGRRIRRALLDHASQIERQYPDAEFARDVGMAERGKAYGRSTVADWIAERNEPSRSTFMAMEVVFKRPGIRVWLSFNVWPDAAAAQAAPPIQHIPPNVSGVVAAERAILAPKSTKAKKAAKRTRRRRAS